MRCIGNGAELGRRGGGKEIILRRRIGCCGARCLHLAAAAGLEVIAIQSAAECVEFKFGEESFQYLIVLRLYGEVRHLHLIGGVVKNRGQFLGEQGIFLAGLQLFLLLAFELADVGQQVFHAAKLLDQRRGSLFAKAFHTGDVVHRVSHERENVDDLLRTLDAPALAHFLHTEDLGVRSGAPRLVDLHML